MVARFQQHFNILKLNWKLLGQNKHNYSDKTQANYSYVSPGRFMSNLQIKTRKQLASSDFS